MEPFGEEGAAGAGKVAEIAFAFAGGDDFFVAAAVGAGQQRSVTMKQAVEKDPRKVLVFRASNVLKNMINIGGSGAMPDRSDGVGTVTGGDIASAQSQPSAETQASKFETGSPFLRPSG